ncbi:MAG: glycosyltransferase [Eubacteriales bacterium]|nr:glycosyltransferase [Eubacteriales bacterium]
MKRIAFFVQTMLCGGVENALIALSGKLIAEGHQVTIYVIRKTGAFLDRVPNGIEVRTIPMDEELRRSIPVGGTRVSVRECLARKQYAQAAAFLVKHILRKTPYTELNADLQRVPPLTEFYDIAVNFHLHSPFLVWYLSERVNAGKKYTWIHNDFEASGYQIEGLKDYLSCVNHFFGVSQKVTEEFTARLGEFSGKTSVAMNIIPMEEILKKGRLFVPEEYDGTKRSLLTVGRLEEQKGYDLAIEVCKMLVDAGYGGRFCWFAVGEGTQRDALEKKIRRYALEDHFKLLGIRQNPYPYFRHCDLYVQPSRHEGWGLTVTEAKLFCRPIIVTDFAGAREQITDGVTGRVVAVDAREIFEAVRETMDSQALRDRYTANLSREDARQDDEYIKRYF